MKAAAAAEMQHRRKICISVAQRHISSGENIMA